MYPHGLLLLRRRGAGQKDAAAALHAGAEQAGAARAAPVRQHGRQVRAHLGGTRAGVLPCGSRHVRQAEGSGVLRAHAVRREASQGAGDGRPLLRCYQAPRGGVYGRPERGAVEAGHSGQDGAQRGGSRPARAGAHLYHYKYRHRPQPADHGDHAEGGRPARAGVPAARKALRRRQRLR